MTRKQKKLLRWYGRMVEAGQKLTPAEQADLEIWDRQLKFEFGLGTSDWPGWEKHIGKSPVHGVRFDQRPQRRKRA